MTVKFLVARENDQLFKPDLIANHDILLKNLSLNNNNFCSHYSSKHVL